MLRKCVAIIWDEYDVDNSGVLDQEEARVFITSTIKAIGDEEHFCQEDFDHYFKKIDTNGDGELD